jgi:MFS family permease
MTHIVPHTTDMGFSAMEAATVISILGIAILIGRVVLGAISDRIGRKVTAIICLLLQGGAITCLLWVQDLWMLKLFALVYGFTLGGLAPAMAALIGDTFGLDRIGAILGLLEISWGIGAAIGPALGGFIFDVNGSYFIAFLSWGVAMFLAALFIVSIRQETAERITDSNN